MIFIELHDDATPKAKIIPVTGNLFEALHEIKSDLTRQGYQSNGNLWFDYPNRCWEGHITFFNRRNKVKILEVTTL